MAGVTKPVVPGSGRGTDDKGCDGEEGKGGVAEARRQKV
jgi:hypothetical protein